MLPGDGLDAQAIVDTFGMTPHPEGGWYAETFRTAAEAGERGAVSAIYFLLREGERSHWHRVDACEIWLWHAGAPVRLRRGADGAGVETVLLGADLARGERPQAVVAEGVWQSAESAGAWSLVSCVVAPAFEFGGFVLAPAGWEPE
jgi:predicted cupin superfamily sugar epimerase